MISTVTHGWDAEGRALSKELATITVNDIEAAITEVVEEYRDRLKYYIAFTDAEVSILNKLAEKSSLSQQAKIEIEKSLRNRYELDKKEVVNKWVEHGPYTGFNVVDQATLKYCAGCTDFYFGRYFEKDPGVRRQTLTWMNQYYIQEGNPIGRGQAGINEFMDKFGKYVTGITERKARQIIDTTITHLRSAARIKGLSEARMESYRIDATGDRLTCSTCRSMDGREFTVASAMSLLDEVESAGPDSVKDKKPFLKEPVSGPSFGIKNRIAPFHPECRCKVVAAFRTSTSLPKQTVPDQIEEFKKSVVSKPEYADFIKLQSELENNGFTPREIANRIEAHSADIWARPGSPVPSKKQLNNFYGEALSNHYKKHSPDFIGFDEEKYEKLSKSVVKNPDVVYYERGYHVKTGAIKNYYIFYKDDIKVVTSDDNLSISSMYKQTKKDYINSIIDNKDSGWVKALIKLN